uniref:Uncharacterized protein n=1 Tax=Peronospora matthiolae TaxID=2874970 RepID=A0AAV1UQY7_9STRA
MPLTLVTETRDVAAALFQVPSVYTPDDGLCSAKTFLQSRPDGVYTCVRAKKWMSKLASVDHLSKVIVEWPFHMHRLTTSLFSMLEAENIKCDKVKLKTLQMATARVVTAVLTQWQATETVDGMLSVLWYPLVEDGTSNGYGLAVHICSMPIIQSTVSTLLVYGEMRKNARCKYTKWIDDRVHIEKHMARVAEKRRGPIHEAVLSKEGPDGDKVLLEGLVTNFFVVRDERVYTAATGVLEGSMRKLVLDACRELSVPVVLEAPKLSERNLWQAAFITSVVRVMMNVTCLVWEEKTGQDTVMHETSILSDTCRLVHRIRDQVSMYCMCPE